ncbi:major paralogous domain-containing protein [Fibrobacter sp. UWCM]|uniref:fibrobacter succinogenes major paralogous domain-containing protein n=1 Tax=Fibrobacter sp. UWCM TaxID=1896208 RepID=UPI000920EB04|nr:fibrobacter succinogenes major paralogous domain-containing protein [Fibrobacter sp. UWCM]SHG34965.1 major paralogous domain-containing protein [Fibrobacter sp. UWCM]
MMNRSFMARLIPACALAAMAILTAACSDDESDDFVGGASGDMGIVAKDIAGLAQKGPFVKGSKVTVQGIDCKTLELTDEIFEGKIASDKGDFAFDDVTLSSTCALFEVSGIYRNEITGNTTSESVTLFALSDLKDRGHVNVNMLTDLECKRVLYLVTEKSKKFADAKKQAEKEVLAAFGIAGDFDNSEDLTIYESGDGNAALLAVSVLMQAGTDVPGLEKRMDGFKDSFAETGKWDDSETKAAIEEWQVAATADGTLDSIRKNVERLGYADEVPAFEKYVEVFGDTVILSSDSSEESSSGSRQSSSSTPVEDLSSSSSEPAEGSFTDSRDGQTYKTVKIGDQVWMAENLNFETDSSYCYNDSAEYCAKYGRLYEWSAAMDACPSGWHLPDTAEWKTLLAAVGGDSIAGMKLKSTSGWNSDGNGTDDFGFTVLPAGGWGSKNFVGEAAVFWTSEWYEGYDDYAYGIRLYTDTIVRKGYSNKYIGSSVRCLKGESPVAGSSSSLAKSSSSYSDGWSWDVPKEARLNPNIKYDSIIDPRDKQVYKVVKIEVPDSNYSQVWMAENLNYADSNRTPSLKGGNWCYQGDEKKCKVSGRYYSWAAAIDSVALANDAEAPLDCGYGKKCGLDRAVQGICPDGWHLPSIYEWGLLSVALGNAPVSGEPLKALTGWNYAGTPDNNGTDLYGFAALPTGRISATKWEKVGSDVYYWSATEYSANDGRYFNINNVYTNSYTYQNSKSYGQSVRCVKGDPSTAPVRPSSSSSVDETKSSSSVTSVSSSSVPEGYVDPSTVVTGTMTDSRDGQTYKTVEIGSQVWMAENLNYAYTGVLYNNSGYTSDSTSWCFSNDPANCIKYGRLYTWAAAMDSVGTWSTNGKDCGYGVQCTPIYPVRGICPEGWHLPDKAEWNTLFTAVGGASTAGKMLSSTISWSSVPGGWVRDGYGTDAYSFLALPAGLRDATGYNNVGYHAYFWSSSEYNSSRTYIVGLDDEFDKADLYGSGKDYGFSVRCVQDYF